MKTIYELSTKLGEDESLRERFTQDPEKVIRELASQSPMSDKRIFMTVVLIVAVVLLVSILGVIISAIFPAMGKDAVGNEIILDRGLDDFLIMIGGTSLGAIIGLFTPNPNS